MSRPSQSPLPSGDVVIVDDVPNDVPDEGVPPDPATPAPDAVAEGVADGVVTVDVGAPLPDFLPGAVVERDRRRPESLAEETPWVGHDPVVDDTDPTRWPQAPKLLARPGVIEQILVIATFFVAYHQTPNAWFLTARDIEYDYSNPAASVLLLGLIGLAVARVVGSIDNMLALIQAEVTIFLFAALVLVSTVWSADANESLRRGVMFVAVTLFAAYLVLRFPLERIVVLLAWMFVASGIVNVAWVVLYPQYAIDRTGIYTGVMTQKNGLGFVAALAMSTLILAGLASPRLRFIFYSSVVVHAVLLLRSESKTMLVAGFAPLALMVVFHTFRGRKTLRGAAILSLTGSGLFALAFATSNIELLARWLDKDVTLTGRVPMWEALMPVMQERLLFGHGWEAAFNGYFSPVHEVWLQFPWQPGDAHNAFIQVALELGLVGVGLMIWTFIRGVLRAIRIVAIVPGPMGLWPLVLLTVTLLVSMTESGMQSDYLGWIMYSVAVLSVSAHLQHRSALGLSNDLRAATFANSHNLALR